MTDIKLSRDNLLTDCERSMRYHMARMQYYSWSNRFIQFIILLVATAGGSNLIHEIFSAWALLWIFAAISMLMAGSLVFNLSDKYYLHGSLHNEFAKLAGDIDSTPNADQEALTHWKNRVFRLYASEPPTYRALNVVCSNQMTVVLGGDSDYMADLTWFQYHFRNIFTFQGTDFQTREQRRREKEYEQKHKPAHPDSVPTV